MHTKIFHEWWAIILEPTFKWFRDEGYLCQLDIQLFCKFVIVLKFLKITTFRKLCLMSYRIFGMTREPDSRLQEQYPKTMLQNWSDEEIIISAMIVPMPFLHWEPNVIHFRHRYYFCYRNLISTHCCLVGYQHLKEQWSLLAPGWLLQNTKGYQSICTKTNSSVYCSASKEEVTLWVGLAHFSRYRAKCASPVESHWKKWKQMKS